MDPILFVLIVSWFIVRDTAEDAWSVAHGKPAHRHAERMLRWQHAHEAREAARQRRHELNMANGHPTVGGAFAERIRKGPKSRDEMSGPQAWWWDLKDDTARRLTEERRARYERDANGKSDASRAWEWTKGQAKRWRERDRRRRPQPEQESFPGPVQADAERTDYPDPHTPDPGTVDADVVPDPPAPRPPFVPPALPPRFGESDTGDARAAEEALRDWRQATEMEPMTAQPAMSASEMRRMEDHYASIGWCSWPMPPDHGFTVCEKDVEPGGDGRYCAEHNDMRPDIDEFRAMYPRKKQPLPRSERSAGWVHPLEVPPRPGTYDTNGQFVPENPPTTVTAVAERITGPLEPASNNTKNGRSSMTRETPVHKQDPIAGNFVNGVPLPGSGASSGIGVGRAIQPIGHGGTANGGAAVPQQNHGVGVMAPLVPMHVTGTNQFLEFSVELFAEFSRTWANSVRDLESRGTDGELPAALHRVSGHLQAAVRDIELGIAEAADHKRNAQQFKNYQVASGFGDAKEYGELH